MDLYKIRGQRLDEVAVHTPHCSAKPPCTSFTSFTLSFTLPCSNISNLAAVREWCIRSFIFINVMVQRILTPIKRSHYKNNSARVIWSVPHFVLLLLPLFLSSSMPRSSSFSSSSNICFFFARLPCTTRNIF